MMGEGFFRQESNRSNTSPKEMKLGDGLFRQESNRSNTSQMEKSPLFNKVGDSFSRQESNRSNASQTEKTPFFNKIGDSFSRQESNRSNASQTDKKDRPADSLPTIQTNNVEKPPSPLFGNWPSPFSEEPEQVDETTSYTKKPQKIEPVSECSTRDGSRKPSKPSTPRADRESGRKPSLLVNTNRFFEACQRAQENLQKAQEQEPAEPKEPKDLRGYNRRTSEPIPLRRSSNCRRNSMPAGQGQEILPRLAKRKDSVRFVLPFEEELHEKKELKAKELYDLSMAAGVCPPQAGM